ncbi:MAG: HPP family protein, partial [Neisseria sp.]|nr:HPP family protein [Neisseria sp.]
FLVFGYPRSPFAQPRNVIGGHFVASLTGLVFFHCFGDVWWSLAVGEATAIALMLLLRIPHPPAASNPLIVMLAGASWDFLWFPTFFGSLVLVAVALFYNNLGPRRYPTYWW